MFDEYRQAIEQVSAALHFRGVGRLVWLLDRGFDDLKLIRYIDEQGQCFVLRAQHMERLTLSLGRTQKLKDSLSDAPYLGHVKLKRLWFDPEVKTRRTLNAAAYGCTVLPKQAQGRSLSAIQLKHPKLSQGYSALRNH